MGDHDWLDGPAIRPLVDELLAAVVAQYRIDLPAAERCVREALAGQRELAAAAESAGSPARLRRMRVFKDAASEAKRQIYHSLRQYHGGDEDIEELLGVLATEGMELSAGRLASLVDRIAAAHASTRERLPDEGPFYDAVIAAVGEAQTLLDVGCGVQPLRFPFARLPSLWLYAAIDSNRPDVEAVIHFGEASENRRLIAWEHELADGWKSVTNYARVGEFDVALLLKLVPVVARQERRLLTTLCKTPARRWIVTGSRTSLAKRASIERRERAVLKKFIAAAGRTVQTEFTCGEEFGYVVE